MVEPSLRVILLFAAVVAALWLFARRYDPQKPAAHVLAPMLAGFLLLTVWNAFASAPVGVNPLSAWLTGALGLPGVGLTVLLNLL